MQEDSDDESSVCASGTLGAVLGSNPATLQMHKTVDKCALLDTLRKGFALGEYQAKVYKCHS
jgi:hypothetical protein